MTGVDAEGPSWGRESFGFFTRILTRWGDCDRMGHINNVIFLRYMECGRLGYLKELLDIDLGATSREGIILAGITLEFLGQIHHPCELDVATRTSRIGKSSLDFESAIFVADTPRLLATARESLVWFDYAANLSKPVPELIRDKIYSFEGIPK